jgi:DNA-binding CsgD family transcriptional regulator
MFLGTSMDRAQRAVEIARELDDPALLARALTACGYIAGTGYDADAAAVYYAEAIDLARALDDRSRLSQILAWQSSTSIGTGDPIAVRAAGEEGRHVADAIGDRPNSRQCRVSLGWATHMQGNITGAVSEFMAMVAECQQARDEVLKPVALMGLGMSLARHGEVNAAHTTAGIALEGAVDMGDYFVGMAYATLSQACLAAGNLAAAHDASETAWQLMLISQPGIAAVQRSFNSTEVALARGDFAVARELVDAAISMATGWHLVAGLLARARIAIAEGELGEGERDAHDALACAANRGVYLHLPDTLEVLAGLATSAGNHHEAARLFGGAGAFRQRMGVVRYAIHQDSYQTSVSALRAALDENDFDAAWAEGAALSTEEVIAYTQRGRGQRKRPASGWTSLTPAERDVARLVCEGLANKEIATRLFVSPRTVQAHLTHIYTKLGISSRVQLVQESARQV